MVAVELIVLVVGLAVGNGLLFFTQPKGYSFKELEKIRAQINEDSMMRNGIQKSSLYYDDVYALQSSVRAAGHKIEMAHSRLGEVEKALKNLNYGMMELSKKIEAKEKELKIPYEIEEKIKRLDEFRRDTRIEIQALKDALEEIKPKSKGQQEKKKKEKKELRKLNKRIHEIVFHKGS
ncbi:MAG: hypothetical protein AB1467_02380 [Candidatus Diapherotrites archaeon]